MEHVLTGLFGIAAVLLGAAANELLRRSNRIETYSARVFDKRLSIYEGLFERMQQARQVAEEIMSNGSLTKDQRHGLISEVIMDLAAFTDEHAMYLDDELAPHCVATFMGAEDVLDEPDPERRERLKAAVRNMDQAARRMIKEVSGVAGIESLFRRVAKPKLESPLIDLLRHSKAQQQGQTRR